MKVVTCSGTPAGREQRDDDHRGERQRHRPRGRLGEQGGDPARVLGRATKVRTTAKPLVAPPTTSPAMAPTSVSRRHQMPSTSSGQNVEAATAKASPTARRDADVLGQHRERVAAPRPPTAAADPEGGDAAEPAAHQVLREHAGDRDGQPRRRGQERGEGAGREQRRRAARRRVRRSSARAARARRRRSARERRGRGRRAGRGRRTRAAAGRRRRAAPARRASCGGRPRRRGWCRSGRRTWGRPMVPRKVARMSEYVV